MNGPLAWCSKGDGAGLEFLQIHVPEAEVICAVATQGTGHGSGYEHVKEYFLGYSEDGLNWQAVEEDGALMVYGRYLFIIIVFVIKMQKEFFVSPANNSSVGILITIGEVTDIFAIV